jgi:hypothetical protein
MQNNTIIIISGAVLIGICIIGYYQEVKYTNEYNELKDKYNNITQATDLNPERCKMYDGAKEQDRLTPAAYGLYWNGKDYYCVWAKDRTLEQQELLDRHEYSHYLVDNDYNHFCTGVNQK